MENQYFNQAQKQYFQDCREIELVKAKEVAKASVRLEAQAIKAQSKEESEERKRQIFEELCLLESGELALITRNLQIETKPRYITNMRKPYLTVIKRAEDLDDSIYLVACLLNDCKIEVFLDVDMAGKASYILRKFSAVGIIFMVSTAVAKRIISQLMAILIQNSQRVKILPDETGWLKKIDGKFEFFGEEDMTWNRAKKMTK